MSFANPLVINSTSFEKINQDSYGSEYLNRDSVAERRFFISHANESKLINGQVMERHFCKYQRRTFATATTPEYFEEAYAVIRTPASIATSATGLTSMLGRLMFDDAALTTVNVGKMLGWQS